MPVPEMNIEELADELGSVPLIDVREPDEFRNGHVAGAVPMPLGTVPDHVETIRSLAPVRVICAAGGRSHRAVEWLQTQGIESTNVLGGTNAWVNSGRHVVLGDETA